MLGTTQLNSILFADHVTFNNGSMKCAHTRQRMTKNDNNNKQEGHDGPVSLHWLILGNLFNSLPHDKNVFSSKFKAFADDKLIVTEELKCVLGSVGNIAGKGESTG